MRKILSCAVLIMSVVVIARAQNDNPPAKDAITDTTIIGLCGKPLATMFANCGTPVDVVPIRGDTTDKDDVICDYRTYMFRVRDRVVRMCFFRTEWKGTVQGIKMGDSREDVVKVLGTAPIVFKDKNGVVTDYGYRMKNLGVTFYANFNDDGKLKRVQISPLE